MSETIQLSSLKALLGSGSIVNETNCVSFQITLNPTGGTFNIRVLKGTLENIPENFVMTLPFGRFGTVKNVGKSWSTGGLLDTVSGPALPLIATQISFVAIVPNLQNPGPGELGAINSSNITVHTASQVAALLLGGVPLSWNAFNPPLRIFNYRGVVLSGVQQLAQTVLAEVFVNRNIVYVVTPGTSVGPVFTIPKSDIVSIDQQIDYSLDVKSVLNPAILSVNFIPEGTFIYDDEHAQKQGNTQIRMGAPSGTGSRDFVEIPDGWMIEGTFEDWTPNPGTDLSNPDPNSRTQNGRYWKVFQSPDDNTKLRGIVTFSRLVKDLKLPKNVSSFVGSPVTAQTQFTGIGSEFLGIFIDRAGSENGIYGFTADETTVTDITQNSANNVVDVKTAMQLIPPTGESGFADSSFYSIQIGLWTFPRVLPIIRGSGDPANPYGLPRDVVIVNPSTNVLNFNSTILNYYNTYLQNYKLINSPRLKTSVVCVYRDYIPQPGDSLVVQGATYTACGRISSVTINYSRGGMTLSIQAEFYRISVGLSGQSIGGLVT